MERLDRQFFFSDSSSQVYKFDRRRTMTQTKPGLEYGLNTHRSTDGEDVSPKPRSIHHSRLGIPVRKTHQYSRDKIVGKNSRDRESDSLTETSMRLGWSISSIIFSQFNVPNLFLHIFIHQHHINFMFILKSRRGISPKQICRTHTQQAPKQTKVTSQK